MEKRIGNLENTVAVHEHKIGELDTKHLGIEDRLTSIEKNLMQIKYSLLGALGLFVLNHEGLLGVLDVMK